MRNTTTTKVGKNQCKRGINQYPSRNYKGKKLLNTRG